MCSIPERLRTYALCADSRGLHVEGVGLREIADLWTDARNEVEQLRADNERLRARITEMSALASVVRERVNDLIELES